ncbi:MAG: ABC transporter substrate-binding protein [Bacillota bacterium]|nr:ABC transporter substrate-binding protein [Bacillota bacterium]
MRNRYCVFLLLILVLALVMTACGGTNAVDNEGEAAPQEITIAYIAMANMAPQAIVASQEEIFEKALSELGVEVKWELTRSLDNVWPMMDAQEVDFFYLPAQNVATYVTETSEFGGSDFYRVIAGSLENNSYTLMAHPDITSLQDLDGKTVGIVNYFYFEEAMLNKQLEKVGLKTKAMGGTVNVEYQDMMMDVHEKFESNEYNAITAWNTMAGMVQKRVPDATVLLNLNEGEIFGRRHPQKWLMGRKELMENNPEIVKAVLGAHLDATEIALAQTSQLPILAKERYDDYFVNTLKAEQYPNFPEEYYVSMWEDAKPVYDPDLSFIREIYDFMVAAGYLQGKTIDQFVDVTLLNEVLTERGLDAVK